MSKRLLFLSLLLVLILVACRRYSPPDRMSDPPATSQSQIQTASPTTEPTPTHTPPPTPSPVPSARIHTGDQALFNGDWETALLEYETAQANTQDTALQAAAQLGIARANFMARNDYETQVALDEFFESYPDSDQAAAAHFLKAQLLSQQEKYQEAAQSYSEYAVRRPGVIDAYIRDLRGDALFAAGEYSRARDDYQAALASPSTLDEIQLRLKLARAYAVAGDNPTALALYDDILTRTNNDYTRALIALRKGEAYTALNQAEQANQAYQEAVLNYPFSYDAYTALVALLDAGVEVDELRRGIVDYYAGQYGPALAALDHYLQNNPADPGAAHYFYALTQMAQGSYDAAIERLDTVIETFPGHPRWDDAWDQKAYIQWAFLGKHMDAVKTLLTFVEKYPGHVRAAEFLNEAALIAERGDDLKNAIALWQRLANTYPNHSDSPRALFLIGLTQYRLKDFIAAERAFQRYFSTAIALEDKASAQFWIGKSLLASGKPEDARAAWQTAAGIDPTGYYSERARDILHNRQPFEPPQGYALSYDAQMEKVKAEEWLRATFSLAAEIDLSTPGQLLDDPYFQRGLELWGLGLYDQARTEFESLRVLSQNDPAQSYQLMNYLLDLGAYRTAIMAARQILDLAGMDDTTSLSAPAYFNHVRFGSYYSELVMPLAQQYSFHPLFIYALIRQESLFESFVSSSAAARGLMQIIPSTGQEIADNLDWPEDYISEDLFRPIVSLTFGMDYLDRQRQRFDGALYPSLAAYNGGPGNAEKWLELAPDDPDLFLELIRFEETRNYIRRIAEIFNIYRLIYNSTP